MKKRLAIGLVATGTALALLPLFAAFEAHVVNVTARIENALAVSTHDIDFGTVFPQEKLEKPLQVALSGSFLAEDRVDDVDYFIRQKPKCGITRDEGQTLVGDTKTGHLVVQEDGSYTVNCGDAPRELTTGESWGMLPLLCPYISKHPDGVNDSQVASNNDGSTNSFHIPFDIVGQTIEWNDTKGHLAKSQNDRVDNWTIDLAVPCFGNYCAQDWASFVQTTSASTSINADVFTQPIANEHKVFGCDLWVEVKGISLPGLGCKEELDVMLVLDRSGSIDGTELQTMKDAANAFVTSLAPTADGVHIGQTSFSTTGSLDLDLTGTETDVHTAINALVSGGTTNLKEGIELATTELDNGHVHERAAVADVMIILTDGNPNQPPDDANARATAKAAADAARAAGIEVFVVGIGADVDGTFLANDIANDAPPTHYFAATDFDDLQATLEDLVTCTQ